MLAINALIFTIALLVFIAVLLGWFLGRPLYRRVGKVCDRVDEAVEDRLRRERLEREAEARARQQAEAEVDSQFAHLKEVTGDKFDENP